MSSWPSISRWRQDIAKRISALLPGSGSLGVIQALVIGVRQDITPEQWHLFRRTGTVHLIAISGLHIGLIAGLIYFLVLKATAWTGILRVAPPRAAAIAAVIAGLFYAALAGFAVPTQRALIMLAMVMAGASTGSAICGPCMCSAAPCWPYCCWTLWQCSQQASGCPFWRSR